MLVSSTSPLRSIPTCTDQKTILFLDGVRYSFQFIDVAYSRLRQTIERLKPETSRDEMQVGITEAMSDAWAIVDSVHRLRGLIEQLPGLKKKNANVQLFLRRTSENWNAAKFRSASFLGNRRLPSGENAALGYARVACGNRPRWNAIHLRYSPGQLLYGGHGQWTCRRYVGGRHC